jgi:hypothetical protein
MPGQPIGVPNPAQSDEAAEGRSWWKVCCMGCCLGFVVIAMLLTFGLYFMSGPGPQTVKTLPSTYPKPLVYLPERASQILYYPATSKNAAARIISGPVTWISSTFGKSTTSTGIGGAISAQLNAASAMDTVSIRWENLNVSREEVLAFYAGALRQLGVYNPVTTSPKDTWDVHMIGSGSRISFDLQISDDPGQPGIEMMTVKTAYPVEN